MASACRFIAGLFAISGREGASGGVAAAGALLKGLSAIVVLVLLPAVTHCLSFRTWPELKADMKFRQKYLHRYARRKAKWP